MSYDFNPSPLAASSFRSQFGNDNHMGLNPSMRQYGQFSTDGSVHDTFRVDRYGNLYQGHTTIDLGGGLKKHIGW